MKDFRTGYKILIANKKEAKHIKHALLAMGEKLSDFPYREGQTVGMYFSNMDMDWCFCNNFLGHWEEISIQDLIIEIALSKKPQPEEKSIKLFFVGGCALVKQDAVKLTVYDPVPDMNCIILSSEELQAINNAHQSLHSEKESI